MFRFINVLYDESCIWCHKYEINLLTVTYPLHCCKSIFEIDDITIQWKSILCKKYVLPQHKILILKCDCNIDYILFMIIGKSDGLDGFCSNIQDICLLHWMITIEVNKSNIRRRRLVDHPRMCGVMIITFENCQDRQLSLILMHIKIYE